MKRNVLIGIGLVIFLICLGSIGYIFLFSEKATIQNDVLSARSKEFLSTQQKEQSSELQGVDVTTKTARENRFDNQIISIDSCYTILIPFQIQSSRTNNPCVYYAILADPTGYITASLRSVGFTTVGDSPDVQLRRTKNDEYIESSLTSKDRKFLVFTKADGSNETSAFLMTSKGFFTITQKIGADSDLSQRQLTKILNSLQLSDAVQ